VTDDELREYATTLTSIGGAADKEWFAAKHAQIRERSAAPNQTAAEPETQPQTGDWEPGDLVEYNHYGCRFTARLAKSDGGNCWRAIVESFEGAHDPDGVFEIGSEVGVVYGHSVKIESAPMVDHAVANAALSGVDLSPEHVEMLEDVESGAVSSADAITVVRSVLRQAYVDGHDAGFAAANVDDPWAERPVANREGQHWNEADLVELLAAADRSWTGDDPSSPHYIQHLARCLIAGEALAYKPVPPPSGERPASPTELLKAQLASSQKDVVRLKTEVDRLTVPVVDSELRDRVLDVIIEATSGSRIAWRNVADSVMSVVAPVLAANAAKLAESLRNEEALIKDRDRTERWADRLAYAIAPQSEIGEHSSANNPWANALEVVATRQQYAEERDRAQASARKLLDVVGKAHTALSAIADRKVWEYPPSLNDRIELVADRLDEAQTERDMWKALGIKQGKEMAQLNQEWVGKLSVWLHENTDCDDYPHEDEACGSCWNAALHLGHVYNEMTDGSLDSADTEATEQPGIDVTAMEGVSTPGCDCGHDGMAAGWHSSDCAWITAASVPATPTEPRVWRKGDPEPPEHIEVLVDCKDEHLPFLCRIPGSLGWWQWFDKPADRHRAPGGVPWTEATAVMGSGAKDYVVALPGMTEVVLDQSGGGGS
jgi:hypothetical protein